MPDRSVRWTGVVASLLLVGTLAACGGADSGEPEAPATSASPAVDADGFTAEQREVVDRVDAFLAAVYDRGAKPVAQTSKGVVTQEFGTELIATSKRQLEDRDRQWLGPYSFEPSKVAIDGDEASVAGCLDLMKMYIAPRGDTELGPGATNIDQVIPALYRLVQSDGTWLVDAAEDGEAAC